jgi:hypothetical protein
MWRELTVWTIPSGAWSLDLERDDSSAILRIPPATEGHSDIDTSKCPEFRRRDPDKVILISD